MYCYKYGPKSSSFNYEYIFTELFLCDRFKHCRDKYQKWEKTQHFLRTLIQEDQTG